MGTFLYSSRPSTILNLNLKTLVLKTFLDANDGLSYVPLANFFSFHSCSHHTKPLREVVVGSVYCGRRSE